MAGSNGFRSRLSEFLTLRDPPRPGPMQLPEWWPTLGGGGGGGAGEAGLPHSSRLQKYPKKRPDKGKGLPEKRLKLFGEGIRGEETRTLNFDLCRAEIEDVEGAGGGLVKGGRIWRGSVLTT